MKEVKIPDSLKPENIMETIEEREKLRKRHTGRRTGNIVKVTASVAAGAVVLGVTAPMVLREVRENKVDNWEWTQAPESLDAYDELYEIHHEVVAYRELKDKLSLNWGTGVKNESVNGSALPEDDEEMKGTIYEESVDENEILNSDKAENEHSETNTQTEGIAESDWVKTDGEYIYHINKFYDELEIIKADGEESELAGQYKLADIVGVEGKLDVGEGYLIDDKLVLQVSQNGEIYETEAVGRKWYERTCDHGWLLCLNVEDKQKPVLEGMYEYEGELVSTRMQEDILYVVTQKNIDYSDEDTVPIQVDGTTYPAKDVMLMEIEKGCYYENYICVAAVNADKDMELMDSEVYATVGNPQMYMSSENIYLYSDVRWAQSELVKISVSDGNMEFESKVKISGYFNDQFSMDEYQGYLRVVYTDNRAGSNTLEIFDKNMESVGKIDDIAEGERVYSARFQGELGYFVTYRETDPLFCVDLSDPADPRILGYLKIPGYSSYLHPITKDRMFGIGYEDFELKISLFDVSDSENPEEIQVIKFPGCYYAEVTENHKALLVTKENTVFGFWSECFGDYSEDICEYNIIQYKEGKLEIVESIPVDDYSANSVRGVQCGDYLYLLTGRGCDVYAMNAVLNEEIAEEIAEVRY